MQVEVIDQSMRLTNVCDTAVQDSQPYSAEVRIL